MSENIGKGAAKANEAYYKLWENQDNEVWRKILDEALSDDDVKSSPASASLHFWRGKTFLECNDYNSAKDDFEAAVKVGKKDNIWRSLAKAAIRAMDISDKYTEKSMSSLNMTAEGYVKEKNSLLFFEQPGWCMSNSWYYSHKNSFSSIFYYISCSRRTFFNTDMKIGEKITDKDGRELTLVSYSDEITTSLGSFTCMKLIYKENEYMAEVWYAKNIGLVKADFTPIHGEKEIYELSEYEIKGGDGYYPMAEGNRWRYTNSLMPEYIYYFNEYEIDWTDGFSCHVMNPGVVGLKKDCDMLSTVGGEYYIRKCDKLCDEWKTEEAIEELKKAVRVNTSERDTISALGGIEYLNEFLAAQRKNYRFCPSSFNLIEMTVKDSKPQYTEVIVSFGPYRFGTRFEENRIFGVKPLRYLEQVAGCLWDDKWEAGFSEERDINVFDMLGRLNLTVENGGTVTTPAGTFTNTLKLTLNAKSTEREGDYYFGDNYSYVWAGVKEYWFARGVGIVKHVCTWENTLSSVCNLTSYSCPAADDSYMPIQIGNRWEYDEENLTREGYRAKMCMAIKAGMADRYLMTHSQQFWYLGTEEEYEEFKKNL